MTLITNHIKFWTLSLLATAVLLLAPGFALAQDFSIINGLVDGIGAVLNALLPILVTLAVVLFFWGLALFIFGAGDEGKRDQGKQIMLWGVIALFVIVSIWGIVTFLQNLLGIDGGITTVTAPTVGGGAGGVGGPGAGGAGAAPPAPGGGGTLPGGGAGTPPAGGGGGVGTPPPNLPPPGGI